MRPLQHSDLMSLEAYAKARADFRQRVIRHKAHRQVAIGEHCRLYFEDRLTIQYQVQEMLRIERLFEVVEVAEELAAYNPLIPDGENLKATLMIEYADADERRQALAKLIGLEKTLWAKVGDLAPCFAIANEDLDRDRDDKTAAVHFVRFELGAERVRELKGGASLIFGFDHPAYALNSGELTNDIQQALIADLD